MLCKGNSSTLCHGVYLEQAPVWQTSSRKEGESQATSVWDLQPAAEAEVSYVVYSNEAKIV